MEDFSELNLIGRSPAYLDALGLIRKFARCDATVLIQGETGTVKKLAARAVHYLGERRSGPFIAVNCGAFTDAKESRPWIFQMSAREPRLCESWCQPMFRVCGQTA